MKRRVVLALGTGLFGPWTVALTAQTSMTGGLQGVGAWTEACGVTRSFTNDSGLALAGLWVAINNDGAVNLPEIGTVSVDNLALTLNWDVDDNEDLDNGDLGENDEIDGTPASSSGWHRAQARLNADRIPVGATFTVRLCDSAGNPLNRAVFLIPMAPLPGQTGGDLARRTELPFSVSSGLPFGSVTIDPVGAPPASKDFAVAVTNSDPTLRLRRLQITPPGGVGVQSASASGGGVYDPPTSTIIWSTPILPSGSVQVNVALTGLVRPLITSVQFQATEFVSPPTGVPALPTWGLIATATGLALLGASRARRSLV